MRALFAILLLGLLAAVLAHCEGAITGTEVARLPLQATEGGGYAPVKFNLTPEMSPVAFNFRADYSRILAEAGKWNSYRATLSKDGRVVAERTISVNHPGSHPDHPPSPPSHTVHTLFIVDVHSAGDYELAIIPASPVAITLDNAQADARRNVKRVAR